MSKASESGDSRPEDMHEGLAKIFEKHRVCALTQKSSQQVAQRHRGRSRPAKNADVAEPERASDS